MENDNNRNIILILLNQTYGFGCLMFYVQLNKACSYIFDRNIFRQILKMKRLI